jgi:hemerythrin-like domain-containing protein
MNGTRRDFLAGAALSGTAALLAGCAGGKGLLTKKKPESEKSGDEVSAVEDLMREHGVLRRALLIYSEAIPRLQSNSTEAVAEALRKTAGLFRDFGEDYHEKELEEAYIFPAVRKSGGSAAAYVDVLIAQHQRGREITGYLLASAQSAQSMAAGAEGLARTLDTFVRMYRNHAAREDTVVFPAWKEALSAEELDEMADRFEEIERRQFGEDGFEKAVKTIAAIEGMLGLADLSRFTAPPPPAR